MWIGVGLAVVIALILLAGWLVDRGAAKRGLKVNVRHSGLRREVSFTRIDDGEPAAWRGDDPAEPGDPLEGDQNRGGSR